MKLSTLDGAISGVKASYTPMFSDTIAAIPPVELPERVGPAPSWKPVVGATPGARLEYRFITLANGTHDLALERLIIGSPMAIGWDNRSVVLIVKIGAWRGSQSVTEADISSIFAITDVPTYTANFDTRNDDGSDGPEAKTGLESAADSAESAEVEIHDGSETGALLAAGSLSLGTRNERLGLIAHTLKQAYGDFASKACKAE